MPESAIHISMVAALRQWIEKNYANGTSLSILVDNPESGVASRPPAIEGHVPDVFAQQLDETRKSIVGEAKTAWDLDTQHTAKQLTAFLNYAAKNQDAILVLIVPWDLVRYARALLKDLKIKSGTVHVSTFVLEHY